MLPIDAATGTIVGRIVGTVNRIPTVANDVVIADGPTLETALSATAPGTGNANEVWLDAPAGHDRAVAAALRRPPFDALDVSAHDALLAEAVDEVARLAPDAGPFRQQRAALFRDAVITPGRTGVGRFDPAAQKPVEVLQGIASIPQHSPRHRHARAGNNDA